MFLKMLYLVNRKKHFITLQTVFEIGSFLFKKIIYLCKKMQ